MISLKAYNQEIEQLIDNGLYDDAIAHSIHILVTFPKCIDSYRNLGKSLLEQKKYSEALDVFSRVLSAIPDDFISHVGLSIIFEDQNNLDLAIWHMEQAFDVQPSNLAIQDELKRLFGRRDGEQPTKIRLTKGALVRMYARGELFQQAITEIMSILEEDPRRIDLEVILARMYYQSGAKDEAETICNRILEKIPYCFEANRILQQIHIDKNEVEAAAVNMNRLVSLDPYYRFSTSPFADQDIPENKVQLEKLDYVPSGNVDSQIPEWLEDIKSTAPNQTNESFNWLTDLPKKVEISTPINSDPFSINDQEMGNSVVNNLIQPDEEIPEWMKKAGWNSSADLGFGDVENESGIKPSDSQDLSSDTSPSVLQNDKNVEISSTVTNEDLASLFTELKEGKMDNENLAANGNEGKKFPPSDWMSQFSNSDQSSASNSSDQDFPDWLKNFQAEEPKNAESSDDMPDWLKNLQSEVEPTSQSTEITQPVVAAEETVLENTTFDRIFDEVEQPEKSPVGQNTPFSENTNEDGWESIDLTHSAIEEPAEMIQETTEPAHTSSDDTIPDWVKSVLINQTPNEQNPQVPEMDALESQSETPISQENSDSPVVSLESAETMDESEEGIISQQTNDELLDWLRGLKTEDEASLQSEKMTTGVETTSNIENEKELEQLPENQPVMEAFVPSDQSDNLSFEVSSPDQVPVVLSVENADANKSETDSDSEVGFTEYANEMVETESLAQPIKEIQTSELRHDFDLEVPVINSAESIEALIISGDFEAISANIMDAASQGADLAPLLSSLTLHSNDQEDNFAYWQCLGDLYSKNNQLNDALVAYQKAEDILVKTISS